MAPRQLCNSLLHKFRIRPRFGKGAHIFEIAGGEPFHLGKGFAQIAPQALDDFAAPALLGLTLQNIAPDLPVEIDQFGIGGKRRALPCGSHSVLDVGEPMAVVGRQGGFGVHFMFCLKIVIFYHNGSTGLPTALIASCFSRCASCSSHF